MVDMHVGDGQRLDGSQREFDGRMASPGATIRRSLVALEQPAIDQQATGRIHVQLVAGARNAILGAMVFDMREVHGQSFTEAHQ
ncbi:hypothetical protein BAY1663_03563 [Pseudomonas sp. BAY1663]|uniref:hypothetical protein n=1 Tax=Pseudomonas sp. BAY1663 TaxID=1439940 RepID=UPI00042E01DE|nr:hypothetical protein [Pseudomonas sp. BAY1663]EXF43998.1 hypothetical protein BAY1663_03563 [Pseudomonas sp. BAY1663]